MDIVLHTLIAVATILVLVRVNGLRSFSKMAGFDFALTVAAGSILAGIMTSDDLPVAGLTALTVLFASRYIISKTRVYLPAFETMIGNEPIILLVDGEVLDDNLRRSRVTRAELMGKLREANALRLDDVRVVVLETTGDISVLHGSDISPELLTDVSWGSAAHRQASLTHEIVLGSDARVHGRP